ncbi:MAG: hypothetical protein ACJ8EY_01540 [Sphingomicrobium sp.]
MWNLFLLSIAAVAAPARAADVDLFSPDTLSLSGDGRLVLADGEESWLDEGFGKLRASGSDGDWRAKPELGTVDLIWQPKIGFAWSATVVGTLQGGERTEAGLSEAFVSYKPMRGEKLRFSARAGLMWPPVSLEHGGSDWHVLDTVTPSAINSWIGEEVRPVAVEATLGTQAAENDLSFTVALMAANDTAGTLLTFRGWALHDRKTLAFHRQPLPPLVELVEYVQPQFTTPLLDVPAGFAQRPGYYARFVWTPPLPVRVEVVHYDNRADPEAVNADMEWGWRTRFDNLGIAARLGENSGIKAQAMKGTTRMGFVENDRRWIDADFRSAFLLLTHDLGKSHLAARGEIFTIRNHGSYVTPEEDEKGWAVTLAARKEISANISVVGEVLHVDSKRKQRHEVSLAARQPQTQVQLVLRGRW